MRAVVQRVNHASVSINGSIYGQIGKGLLVLLGVEEHDQNEDAEWLSAKVAGLRIFGDADGKMNLSVNGIMGEMLIVSQFTLYASTVKGMRPSFIRAAAPEKAIPLYEFFLEKVQTLVHNKIQTGVFAADMQIELLNDGPVTIVIDSQLRE